MGLAGGPVELDWSLVELPGGQWGEAESSGALGKSLKSGRCICLELLEVLSKSDVSGSPNPQKLS